MPFPLGAVIGAGASLAGGLIGSSAQEKANKENIKMQREFAQKGIRWKVADATAAGLHPLAALGANTMSFSPVSVGNPLGEAISNMGQDVSRAVDAASTDQQRIANGVDRRLLLERAGLENDLLRSQIASENMKVRAQIGPPMPSIDNLVPETVKDPQRTSGVNVGTGFKSNPYFSDAQTYEDRYGEVGGSALGLANFPADILYKVYKAYQDSPKKYKSRAAGYPRYGGR